MANNSTGTITEVIYQDSTGIVFISWLSTQTTTGGIYE